MFYIKNGVFEMYFVKYIIDNSGLHHSELLYQSFYFINQIPLLNQPRAFAFTYFTSPSPDLLP